MNVSDLYGYDFHDVVGQLTDGEDNNDDEYHPSADYSSSEYHPSDVGESAHALYAGLLLVPVQRSHAIDEQDVEDGDGDERNEESEHESCVRPCLAVPNARPHELTRRLHWQQLGALSRLF